MRRLCGTVLGMEAVIVLLAIVPAKVLEHVNGAAAAAVGLSIALVALLLAGLVGRPRMGWALYAGSALQFVVIAAGAVIPAMYVLGVIFTALWFTGIWLARKVEAAGAGKLAVRGRGARRSARRMGKLLPSASLRARQRACLARGVQLQPFTQCLSVRKQYAREQ